MAHDDLCEICEIDTSDDSEMSVVARGLPLMIKTSKERGDGMWEYWQNVNNITVHTRCYENYMCVQSIVTAEKRKRQEPVQNSTPNKKKYRVAKEVPEKIVTNCIFCGEICDEAIERKKCLSRRRGIVTIERDSDLNEDIRNYINSNDDKWATSIYERIKDKDSLCGLKYHTPCSNKFLNHKETENKEIDQKQSDVSKFDETMQTIYDLIDNSEECQYSLEDLKRISACDMPVSYIKQKLENKYGDDIIFSFLGHRRTIVTLKRDEDVILSKYYESENPTPENDQHVVKNAARIICDDIQSTLFDSSTYPLITSILDGVGEIIPESLKIFLDGIILKHKHKGSQEQYSKKIQSIAYTIMANTL